ncbi:alpha-ketoacid dehydrogenase subunit beta [bacterium J17]|nr:alpha-ketoacid dehydrogenase subunit beta [bacterium J17]
MIFSKALGATFDSLLEKDPRVLILGEDIADPYGGAFKVTKGLTSKYPERVKTTPVSEDALAGLSAGLALSGYRPITEFMFGDFIALTFNQVVNHIAKYQEMYAGGATCPVILRTPSGGGRGYGPTHSQSLEKHFFGIPHFKVFAASLYHNPEEIFSYLLSQDSPALYIEHKLLYPLHLAEGNNNAYENLNLSEDKQGVDTATCSLLAVPREDCELTVVAYGYQGHLVAQVIERLAVEDEIFVELLVPAQISDVDWGPIERSVAATKRLLTVEEGTGGWSWGSEIATYINKKFFGELASPVEVLASERTIVPSAKTLEEKMLVGEEKIEQSIREILR